MGKDKIFKAMRVMQQMNQEATKLNQLLSELVDAAIEPMEYSVDFVGVANWITKYKEVRRVIYKSTKRLERLGKDEGILEDASKNKDKAYYMALNYTIEVTPERDQHNKITGYTAVIPKLPGCMTCATTMRELMRNIEEAKELWLEVELADGANIPEP